MASKVMFRFAKSCNPATCGLQHHAAVLPTLQIRNKNPNIRHVGYFPRGFYGGRHTVTLLPGAGIGPELTGYVKEIFKFSGVPVDFEEIEIDPNSSEDEDLNYAITSVMRNGVALKGNIETNGTCKNDEAMSRNVTLRKKLDLFVNEVHCQSYPGIPSRHKNVDIVIIRQNIEGEYSMIEHEAVKGVVECMKVVSRQNTERIIRFAFTQAQLNNRKTVTTIHKANIMKLSDGLFLSIAREIAREFPRLRHNDMIIDNACMQMVANPHQFDVILTTNLYGSIMSNVLCGLIGGVGLISGKNIGEEHVVFEPATRTTGATIAGKNVANPIAMLNASIDMLRYLGHKNHAERIHNAILATIQDGVLTPDVGGTATSSEVVENIMAHLNTRLSKKTVC